MRFDIPDSELQWRFGPSGGPGGQHANRSATRAELTFEVSSSSAFDDAMRERLLDCLGATIRIVEGGSRSQAANRKRAVRRLHAVLETAAKPGPPRRRATRPTRGSQRRRLDVKRARGELKRLRSRRYDS